MSCPGNWENNCIRGEDFRKDYISLCMYYDLCPSRCIKKIQLENGTLHCVLDAIEPSVLPPLLEAIEMNRSLEGIVLHSEFLIRLSRNINDCNIYNFYLEKNKVLKELPIILKQELLSKLIKAIISCIYKDKKLKYLELSGLPLSLDFMESLSEVLQESCSLQSLSFAGCFIEKSGLSVLCKCLRTTPSIKVLDLSNCHITLEEMKCLASLIEYQGIQRNTATWYKSLRYCHPNLDSLPGIRRIILNNNRQIEDTGIQILAEFLVNDIWLKALDLQNCGISDVGAKTLLNVLNHNLVLEVLDLRMNPLISEEILEKVQSQLLENNNGKLFEFSLLPSKKCVYCESVTKRLHRITTSGLKTPKMHQKSHTTGIKEKVANRRKLKENNSSYKKHLVDKESEISSSTTLKSKELEEWKEACYYLKRELKICLQQLEIEKSKRKLAEMKIKQLESQNKSSYASGFILIDESTLNTIQSTFVKFQEFLNFLKVSGSEDIIKFFQSNVTDVQNNEENHAKKAVQTSNITDTVPKEIYIPDMIQTFNFESTYPDNNRNSYHEDIEENINIHSDRLNFKNFNSDDLFNMISGRLSDRLNNTDFAMMSTISEHNSTTGKS